MTSDAAPAAPTNPGLGALFVGFLTISIQAFGGVLPWARRVIVERRGWLSPAEFTDMLSLCQFLPGPNMINLAVALGVRFRGIPGAIAAFAGLIGVPMVIVLLLVTLYEGIGPSPAVDDTLGAIAAAAAGLMIATTAKIAEPFFRARDWRAILIAAIGFLAVGIFRWPLLWVLFVLAPLGVAAYWRWRR
ncbi:MAG: chromate transporter [Alphaproteobacteria bacterium]|nr:chromate transporter [Alphaproteobacteria bacterium]